MKPLAPRPGPSIVKRAKELIRRIADRPRTRSQAEADIASLLRNPGVRRPGPDIVRRAREYAADELGDWQLYPELLVYATYRGAFVEGWIPNTFFRRVLPLVNHEYYAISRARSLGRRILGTDLLPDIAICVDGEWFDLEGRPIPRRALRDRLFAESDRVFVKAEGSRGGCGILVLTARDFDADAVARAGGSWVVQRAVTQCRLFERIYPHGIGTLRVMTVRPPGGAPRATASYLKVGQGGAAYVDERSIQIPIEDGRFADFGSHEDWTRFPAHPETGFRFAGVEVEGHAGVIATCEALHCRVPQFALVAWDTVINAQGECEILEWDCRHPGIQIAEASLGPIFAELDLGAVMRRHVRGAEPRDAAGPARPETFPAGRRVGMPAE